VLLKMRRSMKSGSNTLTVLGLHSPLASCTSLAIVKTSAEFQNSGAIVDMLQARVELVEKSSITIPMPRHSVGSLQIESSCREVAHSIKKSSTIRIRQNKSIVWRRVVVNSVVKTPKIMIRVVVKSLTRLKNKTQQSPKNLLSDTSICQKPKLTMQLLPGISNTHTTGLVAILQRKF